jgi:hypothetical protein
VLGLSVRCAFLLLQDQDRLQAIHGLAGMSKLRIENMMLNGQQLACEHCRPPPCLDLPIQSNYNVLLTSQGHWRPAHSSPTLLDMPTCLPDCPHPCLFLQCPTPLVSSTTARKGPIHPPPGPLVLSASALRHQQESQAAVTPIKLLPWSQLLTSPASNSTHQLLLLPFVRTNRPLL